MDHTEAREIVAAAFPGENIHRWNIEHQGDRIAFCRGIHSGDCREDDWEFIPTPASDGKPER